MSNQEDIDRIEGREWAQDVLNALGGLSKEYRLGFWRHIKRKLRPHPADILRIMQNQEAREFGQTTVQLGKHKGRRVDDVPLDYWEWLAEENEKVQCYLASRRVQAEYQDTEAS